MLVNVCACESELIDGMVDPHQVELRRGDGDLFEEKSSAATNVKEPTGSPGQSVGGATAYTGLINASRNTLPGR